MASKFGINAMNNVKTPISGNIEASTEQATNEEIHVYQKLVGSALYVTVMTRVDVAKAVNKLAKHTKNPSKAHFQQIRRVIQYLYNTRSLVIEYSPLENVNMDAFICALDTSSGDNPDRTSSKGYLVQLYGGPINWRATKQRLVTISTTEAELRAATEAAKRLQFHTNLKHVDIYHHWLQQEVSKKRLRIEWVDTKRMVADGLTKVLHGQQFLDWRKHQGLVDIADLVQE
ncbi:conserved hypothetical protein [Talaromyces stipitatus ATCC 10500]|uniref:Reverse transcriptase Ty1/copia-type domain-containing protein n=1 Tax=Talaromyces stipitatus (strain ATCC 10500 / CBS 375.48 / QM 6759 / NRRL 1006) TaxID=441959 RepID=B8MSB3_TALSN|nr:uncharacterized protein TSTA_000430 [Talaromyces stipitatus ATCC 10500]EED11966.1 conserved hypothetical protein [Talaromyces stipitatus ATCC 10500]